MSIQPVYQEVMCSVVLAGMSKRIYIMLMNLMGHGVPRLSVLRGDWLLIQGNHESSGGSKKQGVVYINGGCKRG